MVTRSYDAYLSRADETLGIQVRVFSRRAGYLQHVMNQIVACTQREKLLPELATLESQVTNTSRSKKLKAVLVTSLYPEYSNNLKNMYWERPTSTGDIIEVYQPSGERFQQTDKKLHDQKALAEMYLLSLTDNIVTSARSTFGYVAHSLGGLKPWLLYQPARGKTPDPPCVRAVLYPWSLVSLLLRLMDVKLRRELTRRKSFLLLDILPDNLPQIRRKSIATISLSSAVRSPSALPSNFSVWKAKVLVTGPEKVEISEESQDSQLQWSFNARARAEDEVVVNSSSFGGAVKQEHEHVDEECSRKRFMDLSSVLEPGRTPKTDKPDVLDDAICILTMMQSAEKNELREEKPALKAEKEKTEQQLKSMCSLKVKTTCGKHCRFHVERGRNIGYVKKQISKQKGGDFVDSEILYEGEKLEDQSLINDICRNGDSVLHLLVRRSAKVRAKPVDKSFELSIVALPQASVVTQRKQFSLEPLIVNPKAKLSPVVKDMISSASDMLRSGNPPVRSREGT
ncbi:hypothetical protein Bca101_044087 [Brassica carinata]